MDKEFDLIIINDNIDYVTLKEYLSKVEVEYKIYCVYNKKTLSDLRVELLKYSKKEKYDLLIMGDCDDIFDKNRVSEIKKMYYSSLKYDFYYNELLLFDNSRALKKFPMVTDSIKEVLECNYLGLSNVSVNLNRIQEDFIESLYECVSIVFDWYFFSRIIINGGKGVFVKKAITYYRIHDNNIAGVSKIKQLEKEYEVKKKHYEMLQKYDKRYVELLKKLYRLDMNKINVNNQPAFWWNNIKLLEEK